ncbi:acyl-CoA thioesterase [Corynebacterium sanguinis]|uniref:Acyl-CoA thioesterase n=1 Tax=Corynebacterium sanguinis TaxID=2594913 RepID=A0A6C1TZ11_9CORY|nr:MULTISPECIES: hotdog domain-containing protein [Corynebacterium]MBA4504035.1 acyl-CoA thioesterase [Corynebacterium sanguinis]MCT1411481.1 acyl-CoA thioesterase [Corynebacterium sanguinis]MCT1414386.1 acyl-CoA thioesterase [Corynebacterium sanguinis]MCT1426114.1 acyl-CoA thioesterase [Corynebacterium sanguinis]MCT1445096.1 acyl-CoA thioesterase [Corynebacterium sanguinis]
MESPVATTKSPFVTLRFMAAPDDVILAGAQGVSGGRVLEWIDKAAYACAVQWSGTYCVTAYVGHIHFTRPIPSGHLVEVRSRIAMTGRTSMHIVNEVLSADPREGVFTRACDCLVIFVAKDPKTNETMQVPTFVPSTDEEERVLDAALSRIDLRNAIEAEMKGQTYTNDSTAPRLIHRFLAKPTDINWGGKVHGGSAMEWIDEAGVACTMEWSGERTVAVYAGGIRFKKPISIGDLVEVDARITRTEARSMNLVIQVRSGNPRGGRDALTPAIHATFTYVGVDIDGEPLAARQYTPVTDEDKRLWEHTKKLKDLRQEYAPMPLVRPLDAQQRLD